eukprot:jgi/Mesen1/6888/ME000353S05913
MTNLRISEAPAKGLSPSRIPYPSKKPVELTSGLTSTSICKAPDLRSRHENMCGDAPSLRAFSSAPGASSQRNPRSSASPVRRRLSVLSPRASPGVSPSGAEAGAEFRTLESKNASAAPAKAQQAKATEASQGTATEAAQEEATEASGNNSSSCSNSSGTSGGSCVVDEVLETAESAPALEPASQPETAPPGDLLGRQDARSKAGSGRDGELDAQLDAKENRVVSKIKGHLEGGPEGHLLRRSLCEQGVENASYSNSSRGLAAASRRGGEIDGGGKSRIPTLSDTTLRKRGLSPTKAAKPGGPLALGPTNCNTVTVAATSPIATTPGANNASNARNSSSSSHLNRRPSPGLSRGPPPKRLGAARGAAAEQHEAQSDRSKEPESGMRALKLKLADMDLERSRARLHIQSLQDQLKVRAPALLPPLSRCTFSFWSLSPRIARTRFFSLSSLTPRTTNGSASEQARACTDACQLPRGARAHMPFASKLEEANTGASLASSERDNMRASAEVYERESKNLKRALALATSERDAAKRALQAVSREGERLSKVLGLTSGELEALKDELAATREDRDDARRALADVSAERNQLVEERAGLLAEKERAAEESRRLSAEGAAMADENSKLSDALAGALQMLSSTLPSAARPRTAGADAEGGGEGEGEGLRAGGAEAVAVAGGSAGQVHAAHAGLETNAHSVGEDALGEEAGERGGEGQVEGRGQVRGQVGQLEEFEAVLMRTLEEVESLRSQLSECERERDSMQLALAGGPGSVQVEAGVRRHEGAGIHAKLAAGTCASEAPLAPKLTQQQGASQHEADRQEVEQVRAAAVREREELRRMLLGGGGCGEGAPGGGSGDGGSWNGIALAPAADEAGSEGSEGSGAAGRDGQGEDLCAMLGRVMDERDALRTTLENRSAGATVEPPHRAGVRATWSGPLPVSKSPEDDAYLQQAAALGRQLQKQMKVLAAELHHVKQQKEKAEEDLEELQLSHTAELAQHKQHLGLLQASHAQAEAQAQQQRHENSRLRAILDEGGHSAQALAEEMQQLQEKARQLQALVLQYRESQARAVLDCVGPPPGLIQPPATATMYMKPMAI